jgi:hypothetical protein
MSYMIHEKIPSNQFVSHVDLLYGFSVDDSLLQRMIPTLSYCLPLLCMYDSRKLV